jgi:tetratricopeptide (TPR) repeat protein
LKKGEQTAPRYERLEQIGRGAMGAVYRAFDRESQRIVALKALHRSDPDDLFRLKLEFRSLARLVHPNLLRLYELVVEGEECFFTAEFIEGGRSLTEFLHGAGPAKLRATFAQLAAALGVLHAAQKVHCDLKPNNVLVDPSGRVVLLDFGLITALDSRLARESVAGSIVGTLAYMSPEQAFGAQISPASDWYSFGVLLYEALAGRSPFEDATPAGLLDRRRVRVPEPQQFAPECPEDLAELVMALLAAEPSERPTGSEVMNRLRAEVDLHEQIPDAPSPRAAFVGRRAELAELRGAFAAMQQGELVAVCVEGPSGIGKTELMEDFLAEIGESDALLLRSRCYPHELVAFGALDGAIDELSRFLVAQPDARLEALWPRETVALCTVFPVLGRVPGPTHRSLASGDASPHELRRQGFLALRELLGRIADRRPVVVWIDDLQWADDDSAPLLRELLKPPHAPAILWLFSYRGGDDRIESTVLSVLDDVLSLVREPFRRHIDVGPLSDDECRELAAELAGEFSVSSEAIAAICTESGGSPFLVDELLRSRRTESGGGVGPKLKVSEIIGERLQSLPDDARSLVETIAVVGGPLDRLTALEAAGIESFDPDLVASLERGRILRASALNRGALEIYHDRIREALDDRLIPDVRRERHRGIARVLESRGSNDAHALFTHHRGAGTVDRAAFWAVQAGAQAAAHLAFDQAAHLYRSALELDRSAIHERSALVRLAEALANAGRGRESARGFEEAAALVPETTELATAVELRCRAAEQYLVSGYVDEGVRVLRPLLAGIGIAYPVSSGRALLATLGQLPPLALRYWRYDEGAGARRDEAFGLVNDACHTAAKGLVVVDPGRGAYFAVKSLNAALKSGDPLRIGRALCVVGAAVVPLGGPPAQWARSMLRWASRIATESGDQYLLGMVAISQAQEHFVDGRWEQMLEDCNRGTEILLAHCNGVRWECDIGSMGALRALEELGRILELQHRAVSLLEQAQQLGDVYAEVTFRLYDAFWRIARGEVEEARQGAETAITLWGRESFQLQHLYELRIQACCDLYEGDVASAWKRIESSWGALVASNVLRHPLLASDAHQLRAQAALSLAPKTRRAEMLTIARRSAHTLASLRRADALAASQRIGAAIANLGGQVSKALTLLVAAQRGYEQAQMPLHAAYVQRRHGELSATAGVAERDAADAVMSDCGIKEPERWLAVQAPGFRQGRRD